MGWIMGAIFSPIATVKEILQDDQNNYKKWLLPIIAILVLGACIALGFFLWPLVPVAAATWLAVTIGPTIAGFLSAMPFYATVAVSVTSCSAVFGFLSLIKLALEKSFGLGKPAQNPQQVQGAPNSISDDTTYGYLDDKLNPSKTHNKIDNALSNVHITAPSKNQDNLRKSFNNHTENQPLESKDDTNMIIDDTTMSISHH